MEVLIICVLIGFLVLQSQIISSKNSKIDFLERDLTKSQQDAALLQKHKEDLFSENNILSHKLAEKNLREEEILSLLDDEDVSEYLQQEKENLWSLPDTEKKEKILNLLTYLLRRKESL